MSKLITVTEAAKLANVSNRTIYYHLNKSFKLPRTYRGRITYITLDSLEILYPANSAGVKQHISNKTYAPTKVEKLKAELESLQEAFAKLNDAVKAFS